MYVTRTVSILIFCRWAIIQSTVMMPYSFRTLQKSQEFFTFWLCRIWQKLVTLITATQYNLLKLLDEYVLTDSWGKFVTKIGWISCFFVPHFFCVEEYGYSDQHFCAVYYSTVSKNFFWEHKKLLLFFYPLCFLEFCALNIFPIGDIKT